MDVYTPLVLVGLTVLGAVVAVVDWWAVGAGQRRFEVVAKPATMLVLVAVIAAIPDVPGPVRTWLIVGAGLGLVGDVALLGNGETAFVAGLGSFALGHLAYVGAALTIGFEPTWALPGVVFALALLGYRFLPLTLPGARAAGGDALAGAVIFYAMVISAMVVTAWATTALVAAMGGMLFAVSDWVLGHRRFVGPLPGGRLAVMVPYHVGQVLLVVGLAT